MSQWVDIHGLKNVSRKETLEDVTANLFLLGWKKIGGWTARKGITKLRGTKLLFNKTRYLSECRKLRRLMKDGPDAQSR